MVRRLVVVAVVFLVAVGLVGAVAPGPAGASQRRAVAEGTRVEAARLASLASARSEAAAARLALQAVSYPASVLADGPVGYWRLGDSGGNFVNVNRPGFVGGS